MRFSFLTLVLAAIGVGGAANAAVVGGAVTGGSALTNGGTFIELGVPFTESDPDNSVGQNTFQTFDLYAFNEEQNIVIPSEISVNIGTNPQADDIVASHYVFFDPASVTTQTGFVDFDAEIFGVATSTNLLDASDFLANTGVNYLTPGLRGLESGDSVSIDPTDPQRLLVDWSAGSPGDYVRVFTMESPIAGGGGDDGGEMPAPIPLPATGLLVFTGLFSLRLLRKV